MTPTSPAIPAARQARIKTLTIGGDEITITTFFQLPEMRALDENENLWAHVNYWGVVRPPFVEGPHQPGQRPLWAITEVEGLLHRAPFSDQPRLDNYYDSYYTGSGMKVPPELGDAVRVAEQLAAQQELEAARWLKEHHLGFYSTHENLRDEPDQVRGQWVEFKTKQKLTLDPLVAVADKVARDYVSRHNHSIQVLLGLPQLFIAAEGTGR